MHDPAICVFPWDFADEGIQPVLEFVADSGLTSIYMAGVYHAGWFVSGYMALAVSRFDVSFP